MFDLITAIFGFGKKAVQGLGKAGEEAAKDQAARAAAQARIGEAEIAGAPASLLRLWRSFLGWILVLCFAWEVIVRPLVSSWLPDKELPPSMLKEVTALLVGMLGM